MSEYNKIDCCFDCVKQFDSNLCIDSCRTRDNCDMGWCNPGGCKEFEIKISSNNKREQINMNFGEAFEQVKKGKGMRLPQWQSDVVIKVQYPDENSKMTAPYLYVESRFGRVPWKETMIELFSEKWEIV